jgi:hypothetical protein
VFAGAVIDVPGADVSAEQLDVATVDVVATGGAYVAVTPYFIVMYVETEFWSVGAVDEK